MTVTGLTESVPSGGRAALLCRSLVTALVVSRPLLMLPCSALWASSTCGFCAWLAGWCRMPRERRDHVFTGTMTD